MLAVHKRTVDFCVSPAKEMLRDAAALSVIVGEKAPQMNYIKRNAKQIQLISSKLPVELAGPLVRQTVSLSRASLSLPIQSFGQLDFIARRYAQGALYCF